MSDPQAASTTAVDPLEQWRELRDAYIDIWAKASGEAVNSEAYAQASGTMLEAFLSTSSPFRDAQKKAMVSALEQCNMPSRDDYVRMAERLSNLELLLDDMDARLRQIHQLVSRPNTQQPTAVAQPAVAAKPAVAEPPAAAPEPPAKAALSAAPAPTPFAGTAARPAPHKTPAKITKKGSK